jgi:hypothetical protein
MVVTVIAVRIVQPAIDDVTGMVTMRNRLMATAGSMEVVRVMFDRLAFAGVRRAHLQAVFIVVVTVRMMHVAIMQIVIVITVANFRMAALITMDMIVIVVDVTFFARHNALPGKLL